MTEIAAKITPGHRVASGGNRDPRFPGGTIQMQMPHFLARGLDIRSFFFGTINVSIAPLRYRIIQPKIELLNVKWHPSEPAENFSFFDVHLIRPHSEPVAGLIYYPHPDTKPEHFQQPDVLELLFPQIEGLGYASKVRLQISNQQMVFDEARL